MNKKTLVLGATENPDRYAYYAVNQLIASGIEVCAIGKSAGMLGNVKIYSEKKIFKNIHTITLYLNKNNQKKYYNYIIELTPERVLFNPGTENVELENLLTENGINFERACTLVLLSLKNY